MAARSYLFVPGDRDDMLEKAATRRADALIADLEDAVVPVRRDEARAAVAAWAAGPAVARPERWVRVHPATLRADVAAVAVAGVAGIVVPKIRSAADLNLAGGLLSAAETGVGADQGSFGLIPMIETAAALLDVASIAVAPRVRRLMIGEMDLGAELGAHFEDWEVWLPIRMQVVVASAAAGLPGPIGPVSRDFRDLDGLRDESLTLRRAGFRARAAIHPAQVPVINECFTPAREEVEAAARLVESFDEAVASGRGVALDAEGRMVDEAAVRAARATLEVARQDAPP